MRRGFLAFLILLVQLQFAWGAVAGYCAHEGNATRGHLGHHAHLDSHADANAELSAHEPGPKDGSRSAADLDHGHCHFACAALLFAPVHQAGRLDPPAPPAAAAPHWASHVPQGLDRPNWARA